MKRAITCFLIVFIVVAVATKIVLLNIPQEPPVIHDGNHIVLCHSEVRCPTCIRMERLIKKVLKEQQYADLNINFVSLEYDMPKNREFAERFRIGTLAVILLEQKNGKTIRSGDISDETRSLIRTPDEFVKMLKAKLNEFYGQARHQ